MSQSVSDSAPAEFALQRPHPPALFSLLLGTASLVFLIVTGLPALIVGYRALYAINASGGHLTGRRAAIGGMALGAITSLITLAGIVVLIFTNLGTKSRQVECKNNLGRIGMAVNLYHNQSSEQAFPTGTFVNPALTPDERLSWEATILVYLDEGRPTAKKWLATNDKIDRAKSWMSSPARDDVVSAYLCLDNPTYDPPVRPAPTHYVGIAGVGTDAALLPKDHERAGLFGYDRVVRRTDVQGGISHTLMALETTRENGAWIAGGFPTVRGIDTGSTLIGPNAQFGGCHPNGLNALFVDGSVRFENANIDPDVLRRLALLTRD